jgi:tRNA (uracil-5-)-methyltransferase
MRCQVLGECGGCGLHEMDYAQQLAFKKERTKEQFKDLFSDEITVYETVPDHYRNRVELKVWHEKDELLSFAMRHIDNPRAFVKIERCMIANQVINETMGKIIPLLDKSPILTKKLFTIDFLSTTPGDVLLSLLYHKRIDEDWKEEAIKLSKALGCSLIGRSKGVKIIVGEDFLVEKLQVQDHVYTYRHDENAFTQPNAFINAKIIAWLESHAPDYNQDDLLELYCGMGNLTIPLAKYFKRVCASEISKSSIAAAKWNMVENGVNNIEFARLSSEDFTQAMDGVRSFRRLEGIDLNSYNFTHVLVDPPRSGVDSGSLALISRFETIMYISCNPDTLERDLRALEKTHTIIDMVAFDQFAYTPHLEMGVILKKRGR